MFLKINVEFKLAASCSGGRNEEASVPPSVRPNVSVAFIWLN